MTILEYALALVAAQIAGFLGVVITAGLMRRLDFFTGPGRFIYALRLSSGPAGILQRTLLSLGRAAAALGVARIVLSFFVLHLTLPFAAVLVGLLLVWDLWRVLLTERGTRFLGTVEGVDAVRFTMRAAVPLGFFASVLVGWLFLDQ